MATVVDSASGIQATSPWYIVGPTYGGNTLDSHSVNAKAVINVHAFNTHRCKNGSNKQTKILIHFITVATPSNAVLSRIAANKMFSLWLAFRISFWNLWFIERRSNISWAGLWESHVLLLIRLFYIVLHNIL